MTAAERLIVALDVPEGPAALALVDRLAGSVSFFKVGYELFIAEGPPLLEALRERGARVFLDLKIDDVPATVERAVRRVAKIPGVEFLTIYGGGATAAAAHEGRGDAALKVLQVSLLTSLGEEDLAELGIVGEGRPFGSVDEYVTWRAEQAVARGCDGLICSGQNARMLRGALGDGPLLVCPGIRPAGVGLDDHKRPATPYQTIVDGADYLVVGRPIRDAADPAAAAVAIAEDIKRGLKARAESDV